MPLLVVCAEENGNETAEFSLTDSTTTSLHFPTAPALYPNILPILENPGVGFRTMNNIMCKVYKSKDKFSFCL